MLGSALRRTIDRNDVELLCPQKSELNLLDQNSTTEYFSIQKPEFVIHCAAIVGGIQSNINNPIKYILENSTIDSNTVSASLSVGVEKFIYISSSCIYPSNTPQPMTVEALLSGKFEITNKSYAVAKVSGMQLMESVNSEKGLDYKSLILSNLYGPGDKYELANSHLVASCIRKVHEAKITGSREVEILGNGNARREFTYVEDVATWISESLAKVSEFPQSMNLGYGKDYSVDEFYNFAREVIGFKGEFIHNSSAPEGMKQKLMDSSYAVKNFNWKPKIDPINGIEKSYQRFLDGR